MLAIELLFRSRRIASEDASSLASSYVAALQSNGNILSDWILTVDDGGWRLYAVAPDRHAFKATAQSDTVRKRLADLKRAHVSVSRARYLNCVTEAAEVCTCPTPAGYFLFTTFLHVATPVHCMNCNGFVPLYRIPCSVTGDHFGVLTWQSNYKACDTLQINCRVGERFAEREMSELKSNLTTSGLEICRELEGLAGQPVYYYLFRANGRSRVKERQRSCPSCAGAWRLAEPLHGKFDFKCDKCRLLSNIAWNVR